MGLKKIQDPIPSAQRPGCQFRVWIDLGDLGNERGAGSRLSAGGSARVGGVGGRHHRTLDRWSRAVDSSVGGILAVEAVRPHGQRLYKSSHVSVEETQKK